MKNLILILSFFTASAAFSGTCTSISRTNNAANSILTSSKYNADLNTVYNNSNAYDGGCITDGTLELSAADSSWDALKEGVHRGCEIQYSSASAVSVGPCKIEVNGNLVNTATSATLTMGCGDCSSETASTDYYVYAKNGSSGSTLNLFFSTTQPTDGLGGDGSNNQVLGRIRNGTSSDILESSIRQWKINSLDKKILTTYIKDVKSSGTSGGTCTGGTTWYTRDLNTLEGDDDEMNITLSSNQFTINEDGDYYIRIHAPGYAVDEHRIRLYSVTGSVYKIDGVSSYSSAAGAVQNTSHITGKLTIVGAPETFEVRHACKTTSATIGFGVGHATFGIQEVYTNVEIRKEF